MPRKLYMHIILIIIGIVIADQATKIAVRTLMTEGQSIDVIDGFFSITYYENSGVAFSLLSGHRWVVTAVQLIAMIMVAILLFKLKGQSKLGDVALAMILAGGIGNIIDRVIQGSVTDMISFSIFPPVFNVADIGVTVGCGLLILDLLIGENSILKNNG